MKNILIIGHGSEGLTAAVNQLRDNMVTARPNLPASMKAPRAHDNHSASTTERS